MPRGRPTQISPQVFVDTILPYSERIMDGLTIVSKSNEIWEEIALTFNLHYKAKSLYTLVINNHHKILDKIKQKQGILDTSQTILASDGETSLQNDSKNDSCTYNEVEKKFNFYIKKDQFDKITQIVDYNRDTRESKKKKRKHRRFIPGEYQPILNKQIWNQARLKCGFNYKRNTLSLSGTSGNLTATCKCGSTLDVTLSRQSTDDDVLAEVKIILGSGSGCGPSYLRGAERADLTNQIATAGSVHQLMSSISSKFMLQGDPKAPMLRSSKVLHTAQSEKKSSDYLHKDPIEALDIMKCTMHANSIHDIGKNPFSVEYWSNEQIHTYKQVCNKYGGTIFIDSTGLKVQKIKRLYGKEEKSIFLYVISVNCEAGQMTVAQRLAERHTTKDIWMFLLNFHSSGAAYPSEFICGGSRALLNAGVLTYSTSKNIEEYADEILTNESLDTWIRLDVAHFMKKYKILLKSCSRPVKTFYLAAIGRLILTKDKEEARKIIKGIFLLSNCEMEGHLPNGEPTECLKEKRWLTSLVTKDLATHEDDVDSTGEQDDEILQGFEEETSSSSYLNSWGQWARKTYSDTSVFFTQEGCDVNAYFLSKSEFTKKLLKDLELIPIWGNLMWNKFKFGRIPASSAPVEGEFNKIKNNLLKKFRYPIRVDQFVDLHLKYLKGKAMILDADLNEITLNESNGSCYVCHKESEDNVETCNQCGKLVHTNDLCCIKHNNKIICITCSKNDYNKKMITLSEVENWRGQGTPRIIKKKRPNEQKSLDSNSNCQNMTLSNCEACSNGDFPSGAHKCIYCHVSVHLFDKCSYPVEGSDEGHGQMRICKKCYDVKKNSSKSQSKQSQKLDDQKNVKNSSRKPAKYLGERTDDVKDSITWPKHKAIPVIKNGNDVTLQPINIDGRLVTMRNTCSFDSILYLTLVAVQDFKSLQSKMEEIDCDFTRLVLDLYKKGLRTESYVMRAKVLANYFPIEAFPFTNTISHVNCELSVVGMAQLCFRSLPSFEETSICSNCAHKKESQLTAVKVEDTMIKIISKDNFIFTHCTLDYNRNCAVCEGQGTVTSTLTKIGDIVIFEVFNQDEHNEKFSLTDFHRSLTNPLNKDEELLLVGLINYKGVSGRSLRNQDQQSAIGHYTAFTYRRGNSAWMEMDDLKSSSTFRSATTKVVPRLLVYCKNTK